jgi:hypothetical protein
MERFELEHEYKDGALLIRARLPVDAVIELEDARLVELDSDAWSALGHAVIRHRRSAERAAERDDVVLQVRRSLVRIAVSARDEQLDPVRARERIAAAVVHGLADMIAKGTITALRLEWDCDPPVLVIRCRARGGGELEHMVDLIGTPR